MSGCWWAIIIARTLNRQQFVGYRNHFMQSTNKLLNENRKKPRTYARALSRTFKQKIISARVFVLCEAVRMLNASFAWMSETKDNRFFFAQLNSILFCIVEKEKRSEKKIYYNTRFWRENSMQCVVIIWYSCMRLLAFAQNRRLMILWQIW